MAWTDSQLELGGGIATSLINAGTQAYINQQNIEAQRQAQAQAQRNWLAQQEYNSPKNQVARLEEAGFNPDMLYGQSAGGVAGNAPTPAQTINPPVLNPYMADPMLVSSILKNKADSDNTTEDTRGKKIENDVKEITLLEEKYTKLNFTKQQASLLAQEELKVIEEREKIKQERTNLVQELENLKQTYTNLGLTAEVLEKEKHNKELLGFLYIAQEMGVQLQNEEQRIINDNKDELMKSEIYKNYSEGASAIKRANAYESEVESSNKLRAQQRETEIQKTGKYRYEKVREAIKADYEESLNQGKVILQATESVKNLSESAGDIMKIINIANKLGKGAKK